MKRIAKALLMLSPFPIASIIWEPSLSRGMREIREGNFDKAVEIFEMAGSDDLSGSKEGHGGNLERREAQYGLALCYWHGIGVDMDREKAVELLKKEIVTDKPAADQATEKKQEVKSGEPSAESRENVVTDIPLEVNSAAYLVGVYYLEQASPELTQDGLTYLVSAAKSGHALAQYTLGRYYYREVLFRRNNTRTEEDKAEEYLKQAVKNHNLSHRLREEAILMLNYINPFENE